MSTPIRSTTDSLPCRWVPTNGAIYRRSYHNGACGFSFVDGHAEIKKWLSATSRYACEVRVFCEAFRCPGQERLRVVQGTYRLHPAPLNCSQFKSANFRMNRTGQRSGAGEGNGALV
jgi:prepilin-type processing-associated H-X9-DG protein